jgi:hypothetical protein
VDPRGRASAFAYSSFAPENPLSTFSDPFDPVIKIDFTPNFRSPSNPIKIECHCFAFVHLVRITSLRQFCADTYFRSTVRDVSPTINVTIVVNLAKLGILP